MLRALLLMTPAKRPRAKWKSPGSFDLLSSALQHYIYFCRTSQQGNCGIVDASVTTTRGEIFWNFFLVGNILSAIGHLNGEGVRELLFYLIFAKGLDIISRPFRMICGV